MKDCIDINLAPVGALAELPGIGPNLAERIVEYRERVGRFRTIAELAAVSGITERMIERFRNVVTVGSAADAADEDLPPFVVRVVLANAAGRRYTGHSVAVAFTRREWFTADDGTQTPVWVLAQISTELPAGGEVTISLPNRVDLQGDVRFRVSAPDGELLHESSEAADALPERVEIEVTPRLFAETQPNEDPSFGRPTRLKGRVIDEAGRRQMARRPIVIWGASTPNPAPADFRALIVVETDAIGYFSGPYPAGAFTAANGAVAVGDEPTVVPIHLNADGTFPESVILVVDLDETEAGEAPCACEKEPDAPRDPDRADLGRADGTYSTDPGAGRCVDFTKPDRTLEEFSYSYAVRTTEPVIRGLTLQEPRKIDVSKILSLFPKTSVAAFSTVEAARANVAVDDAPGGGTATAATLATGKIDAKILHTLARDPDGFSLTRLAAAAHLTVHGDFLRIVDQHLGRPPGRTRLTCDTPVDWDEEPTIYQACTIAHGHLLRFRQEWVADGYSMGNLLYSLPLAPGQKKLVAVVDWERRESASRTEAVEEREALDAFISRDRDINDIVNATVTENVRGGSKSSTGSFAGGLGIGAILGPVGGLLGIGGGTSSASSSAFQNSSRSTAASALNQLRDRTIQSASSVRSQRSTVVQTVRQGERVVATTETVANYNHCHAITIQYFEVLRHLLVRQRLTDVQECLFVPLLMSRFTSDKALRWRHTLQRAVFDRRLRTGFDALERIKNNYAGSDLPVGTYADQTLDHLEGDLYLRFQIARPRDDNDDFDPNAWVFLNHLFPFISPSDLYKQFLKGQALKDKVFMEQVAPMIAERFAQHLQVYAVSQSDAKTMLPVDATLVSHFVNDRPLYVSLRLRAALPTLARKDIKYIEIGELSGLLGIALVHILPAGSKVIVESGTLRYRTKYSSDYLFRDSRILNDIVGGDTALIFTPLSRQELRNPREEDKEIARQLLDHLNELLEPFHHWIWRNMSEHRRYMLLDGFEAPNSGGRSVASVVENELVGIVGNSLILPVARGFHLDPTFRQDVEEPIDLLEHYQPNTPIEPSRIAVPTRGVYAEAVMGACNSCEVKEEQRFWRWEESPIPDSPPAILPVSTESRRAEPPNLTAKDLPAPMINLQNAPPAPDPTGLGSALQLLGTANLFKDITGLEGTQRNAAAALQSAFDTAQFFGGKAADLALQAKMAKDIDKTMKTIDAARSRGLLTEQQAQELTQGAVRGMIGGGPESTSPQSLTTEPEMRQAIQRASSAPGGSVSASRSTSAGRENVEVRQPAAEDTGRAFIIEAADLDADRRAFGARQLDKSGQAVLRVRVPRLPAGGSVRWSVPPGEAGHYTFAGGAATQAGMRAEITALRPGLSAVDVEVRDAAGTVIESQRLPLSIPQFVTVDVDAATFTPLMTGFGLVDFEIEEILRAARETCDTVLNTANVRTIWRMAPFGEPLPAQFAAGGAGAGLVTQATFRGDPPAHALYGQTSPGTGAIGPASFDETIDVFAGAFDDAVAGNANEEVDEATNEVIAAIAAFGGMSSPEKALAFVVFGRVLGETLAHEIVHSVIGATLSDGFHNARPGFSDDLMNHGIDRPFASRSGFEILAPLGSGTLDTVLNDRGVVFVNILTGDAQAQVTQSFPVPGVAFQ